MMGGQNFENENGKTFNSHNTKNVENFPSQIKIQSGFYSWLEAKLSGAPSKGGSVNITTNSRGNISITTSGGGLFSPKVIFGEKKD